MDEINPPGPGRASHIHDYKDDMTRLAQTKTFQLSIWQSCHGQLSFTTAPPLVGTKPSCSWTAFSWSSPGVPGTGTGTHFSPTPTNAGTVFLSPARWITTYAASPGRAGTWLRSHLCSSGAGRCLVRAIGPPSCQSPLSSGGCSHAKRKGRLFLPSCPAGMCSCRRRGPVSAAARTKQRRSSPLRGAGTRLPWPRCLGGAQRQNSKSLRRFNDTKTTN